MLSAQFYRAESLWYRNWRIGVLLLMLLGVLDDMANLSVTARMSTYALASLATAAYLLGGALPIWGLVVAVPLLGFGLLWVLNLYNFMDGIDGIAAVQCILAAGCIGLLVLVHGGDQRYVLFCLLLVLSQMGFLLVNWSAARLFMGASGSVRIGFLVGGLAVLGWSDNIVPPGCWLILGAPFIVDATWTLVLRWRMGEPVTEGHRQHALEREEQEDPAAVSPIGGREQQRGRTQHGQPDGGPHDRACLTRERPVGA